MRMEGVVRRHEILMHLRSDRKHRGVASLDDPISDRDGDEATWRDILRDPSESIPDQVARAHQARRLIQLIMSRLSRRERQVLALRYGVGGVERETQRAIAKRLTISRSYVSRIEKKAIRKLGRDLIAEQAKERGARQPPSGG